MIPSVALAITVEMLRDGGSLCAAFQGANGSEYWLVLPIESSSNGQGYDPPVVVDRPFATQELKISWAHAEVLLRQVECLLPPGAQKEWVEPMYECIRREGKWSYEDALRAAHAARSAAAGKK